MAGREKGEVISLVLTGGPLRFFTPGLRPHSKSADGDRGAVPGKDGGDS